MLPATDEASALSVSLRLARLAEDSAAEKRAQYENALKALILDAGGIEGLCTWKANKPSVVVDWEATARELFEDMKVLRLPGGTTPCDDVYLQSVIKANTTTKPGARPFKLITPKEK
jgi:hypothetical protein